MSGSDVSSPEVIRDDGSRSNLMMVASDENIATYPLRQVLDKNDNKTELITTSGIDDDDISAAIASASFVIPELQGEHLLIHVSKNTIEIPAENDMF